MFVALFTSDPISNPESELSSPGYHRVPVEDGKREYNITFPRAEDDWPPITHGAFCTEEVGGEINRSFAIVNPGKVQNIRTSVSVGLQIISDE